MRIAIAGFQHETNTFVETLTDLPDFEQADSWPELLLGEDAVDDLEEMKKMLEVLEEAGYVSKDGNKWELTPRGTRSLPHQTADG